MDGDCLLLSGSFLDDVTDVNESPLWSSRMGSIAVLLQFLTGHQGSHCLSCTALPTLPREQEVQLTANVLKAPMHISWGPSSLASTGTLGGADRLHVALCPSAAQGCCLSLSHQPCMVARTSLCPCTVQLPHVLVCFSSGSSCHSSSCLMFVYRADSAVAR